MGRKRGCLRAAQPLSIFPFTRRIQIQIDIQNNSSRRLRTPIKRAFLFPSPPIRHHRFVTTGWKFAHEPVQSKRADNGLVSVHLSQLPGESMAN